MNDLSDSFETTLAERIHRLRPPDPAGDWLDVHRRARRARRRAAAIAVAAAALVAVPTVAVGARVLDVLGVTSSGETVPAEVGQAPVAHVHADVLHTRNRPPVRLAMPLLAPLLGQEEAVAVPAPDGERIVYHAWDGEVGRDDAGGTPLLRVVDLRTGADTVLARGAQSVAVDAAGRIAYLRASRERYESSPEGTLGGRFGHVLVAPSLDGEPERWTRDEGEYVVLGWARSALLVEARPGPGYLLPEGEAGPRRGIYVLDGRYDLRPLPLTGLVALSPDGRRALGWWRDGDGPPTATRLVDVASGRILATSPLKVQRRGAWHGSRVVVSVGGNAQELAILRVTDTIALERRLPLAADAALRAKYGPFLGSPVFAPSGRAVILRVASLTRDERPRFVGFLTCNLDARACVRGRNLRPPTRWGAIVHNPSRPSVAGAR